MALIDSDRLLEYLIFSKKVDNLTCGELKEIIKECQVDEKVCIIEELEEIKSEIKEWYWQADKQKLSEDPCVVDAMIDLFIRTINKYISELKGENK